MPTPEECPTYDFSSGFETDHDNSANICGLIAEVDMDKAWVPFDDDDLLARFDVLCERSDGGWVMYGEDMVRLALYAQNGNIIRGIIKSRINLECSRLEFLAYNLIAHSDGNYYVGDHPGYVNDEGKHVEPTVGHEVIQLGRISTLVLFDQISREAQSVVFPP